MLVEPENEDALVDGIEHVLVNRGKATPHASPRWSVFRNGR